tara:strand:- start:13581 stop:14525 length:945 start_codon:yes stop_codon:yes gene_type:complete
MKKKYNIAVNELKNKNIILSGQPKAGKTFLNEVVSSMGEANIINMDFFFENLNFYYKNNDLSFENFKHLIRLFVKINFRNNLFGRNINFKYEEESSIWKTNNPQYFFNSIFEKKSKKKIINTINKKKGLFFLSLHNALSYCDVLLDALPKILLLNIISHPIDQIYSMHTNKTYIHGYNPLGSVVDYRYKKKIYPVFFMGYENLYDTSNNMEKCLILKMKFNQEEKKIKSFFLLNIYYEDFFMNHEVTIKKIAAFLNLKKTLKTREIFLSSNFYKRENDLKNRNKKLDFIKKNISKNYYSSLDNLVNEYVLKKKL